LKSLFENIRGNSDVEDAQSKGTEDRCVVCIAAGGCSSQQQISDAAPDEISVAGQLFREVQ